MDMMKCCPINNTFKIIQKKITSAVQSAKTEQELHNKLVSILTETTN